MECSETKVKDTLSSTRTGNKLCSCLHLIDMVNYEGFSFFLRTIKCGRILNASGFSVSYIYAYLSSHIFRTNKRDFQLEITAEFTLLLPNLKKNPGGQIRIIAIQYSAVRVIA